MSRDTSQQTDADPVGERIAATEGTPRRSLVLPVVLAVVSVLAAGALATLWFVERTDHRATTGRVGEVRAEIQDVQRKTSRLEAASQDAAKKLAETEGGLAGKQAAAEQLRSCAQAGRQLRDSADDRAVSAAFDLFIQRCR